jgi:hypothetical protein
MTCFGAKIRFFPEAFARRVIGASKERSCASFIG